MPTCHSKLPLARKYAWKVKRLWALARDFTVFTLWRIIKTSRVAWNEEVEHKPVRQRACRHNDWVESLHQVQVIKALPGQKSHDLAEWCLVWKGSWLMLLFSALKPPHALMTNMQHQHDIVFADQHGHSYMRGLMTFSKYVLVLSVSYLYISCVASVLYSH